MEKCMIHGCNCDDLYDVIDKISILEGLVRKGWNEGLQEIIDISRAASVRFPEFEWIY